MRYIPGIILSLFIFIISCNNTTEPPDNNNSKITLEKIDVSCTEAWIKLTTENIQLPAEINLKRNDTGGSSTDAKFCVSTKDTILYIDSLLPNKTYQYQASSIENPVSSNEISVTTMDTTSHNFTFQTWTFGTIGSSVLHDVAIINENNIWAVGEITIADTSENGSTTYNAVHWDGNEWELKRIEVNFRGNMIVPPLDGVFAFSETDIWFVGSLPIHGDGENWTMYDLRTTVDPYLSLSKVWGSSSSDIYFVGSSGSIAHYNGSQWSKIESGTDLDIYNISGMYNILTNNYQILMIAAEHTTGPRRKIFKLTENKKINELNTNNIPDGSLYDTWFKPHLKYYVVGNGIFTKNNVNNEEDWKKLHEGLTPYYTYSIDGANFNNIFVCGSFGELLHFNGFNWKSFRSLPGFSSSELYKVKIKNNLIVAAGYSGNNGFVTIGKN